MEQAPPMEQGNVLGHAPARRQMAGQVTMPGRYRVVNKRHYRASIVEELVNGPFGAYTMRNQGIPVVLHPGSVVDDVTLDEVTAFPDRFVATNDALVLTDEHGQPLKDAKEIAAEREAAMRAHVEVSAREAKARVAADEAYKKAMADETPDPVTPPQGMRGTSSRSER